MTDPFADPAAVARYAQNPPRMVPGFADMQRMTTLLLAERVPADGRVLVVGAGGGLELKVFADADPGWRFDGVDPSAAMLRLAEATLGERMARVALHEGTVDAAPDGPFDGAVCLLVLHFVERAERARTLAEVRRRLAPGAPFVVAHLSIPAAERDRGFARYAAFAVSSGIDPAHAATARERIEAGLTVLDPAEDEAMLRDAGFRDVALFYAGFAFRGWVASA